MTNRINIETHLLDFDGDLYDRVLTISFLVHLRDEMKFEKISDLVDQIQQDVKNAKKLIYISRWL